MKKFKFYFWTFFITGFLVLVAFAIHRGIVIYQEEKQYKQFTAKVIKVYDGDTVKIKDGKKVRLLGINTPELHHPDLPVQKYAVEAHYHLRLLY